MTLTAESSYTSHSERGRFDKEIVADESERWIEGLVDRHLGPVLADFDRSRFESGGHEALMEGLYGSLLVAISRYASPEDKLRIENHSHALKSAIETRALARIDRLVSDAVRVDSEEGLTQEFVDRLADIKPSSEESAFYLSTSSVKRQMDSWFATAVDAIKQEAPNTEAFALAAMYYGKNSDLIPDHYVDTGSRKRVALVPGVDYRLHQAQIEHFVAVNENDQATADAINQYFRYATGVDIDKTYTFSPPPAATERFYKAAVEATRKAQELVFKGTAGAASLGLAAGAVPAAVAVGLPQEISELSPREVVESVEGGMLASELTAVPSFDKELSTRGAPHITGQLESGAMQTVGVEPVTLGEPTPPTVVEVSVGAERVGVGPIPKGDITLEGLTPEEKAQEMIQNGRPDAAAEFIAEAAGDSEVEVSAEAQAGLNRLIDSYKGRLYELRKNSMIDSDSVVKVNSAIAYLEAGVNNPAVLDSYLEVSEGNDMPMYIADIYASSASDEALFRGIGRSVVEELSQNDSFIETYGEYSLALADLHGMVQLHILTDTELQTRHPDAVQSAEAIVSERVERETEEARLRALEERAAASESEHSELLERLSQSRDAAVLEYFSEAVDKVRSSESRFNPMDAKDVIDIVKATAEKYPHDVITEEFMLAVLWQESMFDKDIESHAGAGGIAQFMPETAKRWVNGDRFDPVAAIDGSFRFYQHLYGLMQDRFPEASEVTLRDLALAGYNAGPYNAAVRAGRVPNNGETNVYVDRITGLIGEIAEIQDVAEGDERQAIEEAERQAEADRRAYEQAVKESRTVGYSAALSGEKGVATYYQTDPEWKDIPYRHPEAKEGTLGECGCGPTIWASAVATLHRNDTNPAQVGESMMDLGAPASPDNCFSFHVWDFEHDHGNPAVLEREYNVIVERIDLSNDAFKETLRAGGMIMMSQGPGEFTNEAGHLMLVTGMRNLEGDSPRTYFVMNPANEEQTNDPDGFTAKQLLENARHGHAWAIYKATPDEVEAHIEARQQAADEREAERQRQEEEARRKAEEAEREARERAEQSETGVTAEGWAYPVKSSDRACGFDCYKNHRGMDISDTAKGEPFYSIREGVVVHAGVDDQMNSARCAEISANLGLDYNIWRGKNQVVRIHSEVDGVLYEIRYSHLEEGSITVSTGETVGLGKEIGKVGLTGCTTGVHAHIDIKMKTSSGWVHVDPTKFFGRSW